MRGRRHPGRVVLLTGVTGHLGANLLRRLLADGERVRVLLRRSADERALEGLDVERAYGDLRDADAVARAVKDCAQIYHCAALVSTVEGTARHKREMFDCNVLGTRRLLTAARQAGVDRVVVTGSFSALGCDIADPSAPVKETQSPYPFARVLPYTRTKVLVEHECLRAAADGLDVVVAISTGIVGPHDYKPSRLGRTLCDYANGRLRFIVPGEHEFVTARDIVEGHMLAMKKGRSGQTYTFSSAFLSLDEMISLWRDVAGPQPSYLRLPARAVLPLAEVASFVLSRALPSMDQRFTPGAIRRIMEPRRADTTKAQDELGFRPTPVRAAVAEAFAFHASLGRIAKRETPRNAPEAAGAGGGR